MASKTSLSFLVVDDDETICLYLKTLLRKWGEVHTARTAAEATDHLTSHSIDVALLDLLLAGGESGLAVLRKIKETSEEIDVIVVSGVKDVRMAVSAIKQGASDFVSKPIDRDELAFAIDRIVQRRLLQKGNILLKQELADQPYADNIVGESEAIREVKAMIAKLRGQEVNTLIVGDTGTGKEMFARLLHRQEGDPQRPFVSVNCAAIPDTLLESVLFGHEKGSFTGATERRIGKFELADGGDIFLDEVASLPFALQGKLLRVLEEKEVERVGSTAARKISFRVISASDQSLLKKVAENTFRSDLFYRLNTVTIQLPSLAERLEDIVPLAEHFLQKCRRGNSTKILSPEVKDLLLKQPWPGNVRELRNTIENMIVFSKGEMIGPDDAAFLRTLSKPAYAFSSVSAPQELPAPPPLSSPKGTYDDAIRVFERDLLVARLERNRWSKTKTCRELGISRNKLYRKMEQLGIQL